MRALVTFDCFDTVVTRAVGGARGASHVLAEHLRRGGVGGPPELAGLAGVPAQVLVSAHLRAEHLAYRRHGERRDLGHSSAQLAELLGLPAGAAPALRAAEEAVELALTRPVPRQLAAVRAARATGAQVGFLSDTALGSSALGALLRRCGALEDGDLLWTSNELGAEKGQGRAYAAVAADLGPQRRPARGAWRHTGDDARSDVLMARLSGVRATAARAGRLNRFERALDAAAAASGGTASLLAGASRRARLVLDGAAAAAGDGGAAGAGGPDPARTAVVAGVVGPVLAGLTAWALHRAAPDLADAPGPADELVLAGPGAGALAAVAAPLAAVLAPGTAVVRDGGARPARGGRALRLDVGALTAGYLRDDAAGTGLSGEPGRLADAAAALTAAAGPDDELALAAFAAELAGALPLLHPAAGTVPGLGPPDVREALERALEVLWHQPGPAVARTWLPVLAALPGGWPGGEAVLAPAPRRLARRAASAAGARLGPKLARAGVVLAARRTALGG